MNALIVLVAATTLGVEVGWEPLPGGGHEYTLQLEPQLLKVLESGEQEIFSEVPAGVEVRRYRVVVGVGKLRRDFGPLEAEIEPPPATAAAPARSPAITAAPQAPAFSAPPAAMPPMETPEIAVPAAADPYAAGATTATPDLQSSPVLETVPPAAAPAAAPDFGLPAESTHPSDPAAAHGDNTHAPGESSLPTEPTAPADDLWHNSADQPVSEGKAEQLTIGPPAKLPAANDPSAPIKTATFEDGKSSAASELVVTGKPKLSEAEPAPQPWTPLVVTIVLLACSLGGNIFLGWIAADARARYRNAVAKVRGAAA